MQIRIRTAAATVVVVAVVVVLQYKQSRGADPVGVRHITEPGHRPSLILFDKKNIVKFLNKFNPLMIKIMCFSKINFNISVLKN